MFSMVGWAAYRIIGVNQFSNVVVECEMEVGACAEA
jgi:hypothetical protein